METNFKTLGNYNIKSGEIFLTSAGNMTIHCTLCERKFFDFSEYTSHVGSEHLPKVEVQLFSVSENSADIQADIGSLDFFQSDVELNVLNALDDDIIVSGEELSHREPSYNVNEEKKSKNSGPRTIRKRKQQYDEKTNVYKCNICDFACSLYKNLVGHKKRHSQHKPYQCSECEKAFYTGFELKIHSRSHTGERPYLCNECGQNFITSGKLAEHMKRHKNEKNYQCEVCKQYFFNTQNLRKHLAVHSEKRSYVCKICKASFKRLTALTNHQKLHANKKEYRCEMCPARFNQRPGLYSHLKSKHPISEECSAAMIIEEPIEIEF